MVDIRRIDKITRTMKAENKVPAYSDFYNNFNVHPETGSLVRNLNDAAVKRSIRNLILTETGDRLFQPNIACNINSLLFENISSFIADNIKIKIEEIIGMHESRAKILQTIVVPNEVQNSYEIAIIFEVINSTTPSTVNLTLYRVR